MTNINAWLETIPGLKTEKGAQKRLDKVMSLIVENRSKYMIFKKNDGTFVPLVFANSNDWAAASYAWAGVCVTN